jgi:carbamoyltransferase
MNANNSNQKYTLAVHVGHNAAVCIGNENGLLFAIQEERLCGEKNYWGFPRRAIDACLRHVNAKTTDVDRVVVGTKFVLHRYHSREDVVSSYDRQLTPLGWLRQAVGTTVALRAFPDHGQSDVRTYLRESGLGHAEVEFLDHHRMHAATAYYGLRKSRTEPYLVLTCDGSGDGLSGSVRVWSGTEEKLIATTADMDSLGTIYALTTHAMGFTPLEHEYKLMGMAPYTSKKHGEEAAKIFQAYLDLDKTGLSFQRKTTSPTYGLLTRILDDIRGQRFDNICAGLQLFTEDLLMRWVQACVRHTGVKKVLAAGGVFMNVKANKAIASLPEVEFFEAYPSCGDETLAMGALSVSTAAQHGDAAATPLDHFYLGDDLDDAETERAVTSSGFVFEKPKTEKELVQKIVDALEAGHPVARCAGRMEFGARALCNRSIMADPKNQDVVRIINQMVKKRDFWMPFAPVVLEENAEKYMHINKGITSPYMMMTYDTRDNFRDMISAVHNADLTCRAQVLQRKQNPQVAAILDGFAKKTGRHVLLNTSFNLHGFPIVRTAAEALDVFRNSGLTHIQVGSYWLKKQGAA